LTWPGQDAGFLGRSCDSSLLNVNPAAANFEIPGMTLPGDVPGLRFDGRRSLLQQVNQHLDGVQRSGSPRDYDAQSRQAFDLIASTQSRQAFDLSREPDGVRDRYGRLKFGQSLL